MTNTNVTTDAAGEATATPQPKVIAAASGAAVGAAVTTIGVYLIETLGNVDLPAPIEGAALVLVTTGLAFLAGYLKRPSDIS